MATENFDRLHERVLQFVGAFTQAQFSMDYAIDRYVAGKMPRVGPAITAQFLGRVRDDQRLVLFMSVAAEVESAADVSNVEYIFNRAKQCRDTVAHAAGVIGPVTRKDAPPYVALASFVKQAFTPTRSPPISTLGAETFCDRCWALTVVIHRLGVYRA